MKGDNDSLYISGKSAHQDYFKCNTCGFVAFGEDPDIAEATKCLGCGNIMGDMPSKKGEMPSKKESTNQLLIVCGSCSQQFSKRANACPRCGWKPQLACQICQQKIPFDSTVCPECGDPSPLTKEHIKEQKTNDPTILTSYSSKQNSTNLVNDKNNKPHEFSLSWFLFSFDGRISRQAFWCAYPVIFFLGLVIFVNLEAESINNPGLFILALLLLWPSLAIQVKRWQDRNKSGIWVIINMIPIFGFLWIIIELGFLRGTVGNNKYGNDPLSN